MTFPMHLLLFIAGSSLVSSFSTSRNYCQNVLLPSIALERRISFTALSSNAGDNETTELLEKARRLREEAASIENTKREAEELAQKQQLAEQTAEQERKNEWKDRYSVIVPILKDMGEEVMERVDFAPRIKGGKRCSFIHQIQNTDSIQALTNYSISREITDTLH